MKPHKHAELIKAWADGQRIQHRSHAKNEWTDSDVTDLYWRLETEYRVKPAPTPDLVMYTSAYAGEICPCDDEYKNGDNLKLIFDGETGELKKVQIL